MDTSSKRVSTYIPGTNKRKTIRKNYGGRISRPFKRTSYDGVYYVKLQASFPVLY